MWACRWHGPSRTASVSHQWARSGQRRGRAAGAADGVERAQAAGAADGRARAAGGARCSARHAARWGQAWCPVSHCSRHWGAAGKRRGTQCRSAEGIATACVWVMLWQELHGLWGCTSVYWQTQEHHFSSVTACPFAPLPCQLDLMPPHVIAHRPSILPYVGRSSITVYSILACSCLCITAPATSQLRALVAYRPSCSSSWC